MVGMNGVASLLAFALFERVCAGISSSSSIYHHCIKEKEAFDERLTNYG
jgi:hypothetical protein